MQNSLLPFLAFAFVATATPGPNNILVLTAAATSGLRTALPIVFGVALGFSFMVGVVGSGLAGPLADHPGLHTALRWLGAAWMLFLAWKIATAGPARPGEPGKAPLGFWKTCAFQWINPKAWIMAVATTATYTTQGDDLVHQVLILAALFVVVSLPVVFAWALLGAFAARILDSPSRQRRFNLVMGLLLAASVIPAVLE